MFKTDQLPGVPVAGLASSSRKADNTLPCRAFVNPRKSRCAEGSRMTVCNGQWLPILVGDIVFQGNGFAFDTFSLFNERMVNQVFH